MQRPRDKRQQNPLQKLQRAGRAAELRNVCVLGRGRWGELVAWPELRGRLRSLAFNEGEAY